MEITILCDVCGWEKGVKKLKPWIGRKCPTCGSIPINSGDVFAYRHLKAVEFVSKVIKFIRPKSKTKSVLVSSLEAHKTAEKNK